MSYKKIPSTNNGKDLKTTLWEKNLYWLLVIGYWLLVNWGPLSIFIKF